MRINKSFIIVLIVLLLSFSLWSVSPKVTLSPTIVKPGQTVKIGVANAPNIQVIKAVWPDGTEGVLKRAGVTWSSQWQVPEGILDGDFQCHVLIEYKGRQDAEVIPVDIKIRRKEEPAQAKPAKAVQPIKPQKQQTGDIEKPININLRNVELTQVLKIFARQGNLNILSDKSVRGMVSFSARNIPIMKALDMVLKSNGYSWSQSGNNIIVSFKKPARTFILSYINAAEAKTAIQDLLPSVIGVSTDDRLNSVTVRGNLADLEEAAKVINDIDIRPLQVLIEARIIEINAQDSPFVGVGFQHSNDQGSVSNMQAGLRGTGTKATDTGATKGFFALVMENNIEAWLETLQTTVHTDLLANTKIMATNNRPARIITGEKLGYHVRQISAESTIESVEFLEVGTQLSFTPRISQDGYITLQIQPEVSEGTIVNDLPQENTTEVDTEVTVQDGQSIIIGGLIRNKKTKTVNGIPYLMDMPGIGAFFRSTGIIDEKKETIVVITPHIVNDISWEGVRYQPKDKIAEGGLFD
ncbi:secretin N-terminal domain-containing protein [Candidatus Margulisiibacteriota bacterium]